MTSTKFVNAIVDYHTAIDRDAAQKSFLVRDRFRELLQNPTLINDDLAEQFLEAEMSITDLPESFWEIVAEGIEMGFDTMHEVPLMERGEAWEMAREMLVGIARRQAMIEGEVIYNALVAGTVSGNKKLPMLKGLDARALRGTNFKKAIAERKDQEAPNVSNDQP